MNHGFKSQKKTGKNTLHIEQPDGVFRCGEPFDPNRVYIEGEHYACCSACTDEGCKDINTELNQFFGTSGVPYLNL